jgi:hypothetical protein
MIPVRYAASPESDKKGRAALTHQGCRQCEKKKKGRGEKRQDGGYQGAAAARALFAEQQASWSEEEKTYGWWRSARLAKGRRHVFQDQSLARARWWVGRGERRRVGVVGGVLAGTKNKPKERPTAGEKIAPAQQ